MKGNAQKVVDIKEAKMGMYVLFPGICKKPRRNSDRAFY